MRFGLAAKLSLLAALLVFGTGVMTGYVFFWSARSVVRGREIVGLRDEAELYRGELLAALDRAPADLLAVAGAPATRTLLSATGDAAARARLADTVVELFKARPHYVEMSLLAPDLQEAARIDRTADGPQAAPPAGLQNWRERADDLALTAGLAAPAVGFSAIAPGPGNRPPLQQVLTAPVTGVDGRPVGWLFLRIDFAALTARLNRSPRLYGFLVDSRGEYLAHPDPALVGSRPGGAPLDQAFRQLDERSSKDANAIVRIDDLRLPGLTIYAAAARFSKPPPTERLRDIRDALVAKYPGIKVGRADGLPERLTLRAGDADMLKKALHDLRDRLDVPVNWDEPYRCESYLACLLPVRPAAVAVGPPPQATPPVLRLALAAAHEEVEHEIVTEYWKNFLFCALLAGGAGFGMLAFAVVLTGSLRRMTAYAEKVAAGNEADVEMLGATARSLPGGRDEIGTLSRAFRRMIEQVRLRTKELRESEARIRTILSTAAEGIVTIDESGRLESFNLAAERIFGYQADEVRGEHFRKLISRGGLDDPSTLLGPSSIAVGSAGAEASYMSMSRVNNTTREVIGRRRSGERFPVEMSVSEVVLGDRLVYTAILRDITERKQAEVQIRRMTEELEHRVRERTAELVQANQALEAARDVALDANRAKDAFLAVMSHELRTPLTAIIGYCDYWLGEAEVHDPDEMLDDLRKMQVSARHLLTLINDILDLAKIQAGKMVLDVGEFEVPPLLTELKSWVEPLVRRNANLLVVQAAPGLGSVRADRTRIRQVLLNLLSNAAKFTSNGTIQLEVERQSAAGRPEEIVFRVADTGVGMKAEDVRRLFQPFVQVDSSSTRKHEGTGLGLAISRKLCELMGGTIGVESALGVGTTFTVRLPANLARPDGRTNREESAIS
jgi:signal transduction histidine kinase/HAMP domain-containing protein